MSDTTTIGALIAVMLVLAETVKAAVAYVVRQRNNARPDPLVTRLDKIESHCENLTKWHDVRDRTDSSDRTLERIAELLAKQTRILDRQQEALKYLARDLSELRGRDPTNPGVRIHD